MNREDIIRMAREAGAELAELPRGDAWLFTDDKALKRFAALVASAEREACAKLLEEAAKDAKFVDPQGFVWQAVHGSAEFIRARGQA